MKTVWVVYDPLCEKVISVHKTEEGAAGRCNFEDNNDARLEGNCYYRFEYGKFVVEE